ncbi:uncharacterized protein LOC120916831 [Rana temporaria]|uniref:uncharacterized protein LOC120916831 n=1 Tax=Rana temporaria TaxID=8407 RepID=UPI001AADC5C1|nr:uncharacterized protein LOC120916831 [Rana temporaria]
MDFVGTAWSGLMTEFQTSYNGTNKDVDDLRLFFGKLKYLLKKKSNLYWHMEFFKEYIKENISPMGLRIQMFPTIKNASQDLKNSWEGVLNKCSKECMQLLLIQYQSDTNILDRDLALLITQYEHVKTHPLYADKHQELKVFLDKLNKSIISKKQSKMAKDRMAFVEGYAYRWDFPAKGRGRSLRKYPPPGFGNSGLSEEDFESDSSLSSSSFSQMQQRPTAAQTNSRTRKREYQGGGHPNTPSTKKKPTTVAGFNPIQGHSQGVSNRGEGPSQNLGLSHFSYTGPLAAKAVKQLHPPSTTQTPKPNVSLHHEGALMETGIPSLLGTPSHQSRSLIATGNDSHRITHTRPAQLEIPLGETLLGASPMRN